VRALLAVPGVRLYLAGQGLSLLGDTALSLAMGIWVKELTGSSGAAAVVVLLVVAPQLASPLCGVLVDRVRRRPLLIAVNVAAGAVVLALLLVRDAADVWIVYAVMTAYGAGAMIIAAAQSALLATVVEPELLGHANAVLYTLRQGLRLVGPLAGAGLFAVLGGPAVAALDAVTFVGAAAALTAMRVHEPRPVRARRRLGRAELTAGMRHIAGHPLLRRLVATSALTVTAFGLSEAVLFAVVDDGLGRPAAFMGVLVAAEGAGALVTGAVAPALLARTGEPGLCASGMLLASAGTGMLAVPSTAAVVAGAVVFGAGVPLILIGAVTLLQRSTPAELQGRAYSALEMALALPQTAAIGAGAALVGLADFRLLLGAIAALQLAAAAGLAVRVDARCRERPDRSDLPMSGAIERRPRTPMEATR